jgi:Uri superfamily endonuclease
MNYGSYRLHIHISKEIEIKIGKLGTFSLETGNYIYTGSAMRNLCQRIQRHLSKNKKIKWHIDYLLANENVNIYKVEIFPSKEREECQKNQEIMKYPGVIVPIKGFGASDCKICESHLIKFTIVR